MIYHYSMEPHTAIAQVDGDGITIWPPTSQAFGVRQAVADVFHMPLSKVRVHVNFVGGAYGSKSGAKIEPLVAALAHKAERPVRVMTSVTEAMLTCRRHAIRCKVKTGAKRGGTLVAKQADIFLNTGAYAETGPTVAGRTLTRILGALSLSKFKNQLLLRLYQYRFSRFVPFYRRAANRMGDGIADGYHRAEARY